ncbi:ATP-grasp domain-containing protein [Leifsonia sp. ZF2019]|uniref:acetyl/propionyl/methylcrotonyl-CoA carboxylase subunit alpha n=1 Tax=Leifsonia sp. ZF2019 TaxID=2781978 RepID=UPI001CBD5877|nr:biotin carboxylase N-terminal domain-containing protein [Leifsonia sp. ZF2019]UAJ78188.1 ATP-grasp domain-containing protein [Leifsonia sp. ZF2019]
MTVPFSSVLVANRGEIACRVIRTLRRLGIRSVAVYSDADRDAPHVALADLAVRLGPAPARESYLDVDAIVAAATATGAQAVHPGYGFLSENAALAQACADAGIAFVGPGVHALEIMGDKIAAKREVEAHGVPTIPGIAVPGLGDDALIAAAERIGYPVLVKPSAGGGGKGMQAVRAAADLPEALRAARRVAASAFGDDTLFLERLVDSPRHIEVQVLADGHGSVVHLGERECSLQRRHQKVIEEAPSPLLDAETRDRIGRAACRVADSVGYRGAGTVEFLVSADAPGEFFFMEMNTRLQVEHPVTELVTGLDLVEWQLRIAAGEPLGFAQADVHLDGHAVEARVYAEDPERGFLPGGGTVLALREPDGEGVRVDSGLAPGLAVVTEYDPMLAKVIAWGEDRATAIARLDAALAGTSILGATGNVAWLRELLADPDVLEGTMDTTLIDRRHSDREPAPPAVAELVLAALLAHRERTAATAAVVGPLWAAPSGWRMSGSRAVRYEVDGVPVAVSAQGSAVTVGESTHTAALTVRPGAGGAPDRALLTLDGITSAYDSVCDGGAVWLAAGGRVRALRLRSREERLADELAALDRGEAAAHPEVRSPMPGTVVAVPVVDGDAVAAGDTLAVVEAMKMEHRLLAPVAGTVRLHVAPGDLVRRDQLVAAVDLDEHTAPAASSELPPIAADGDDPTRSPVAAHHQGQSPQQTGTP